MSSRKHLSTPAGLLPALFVLLSVGAVAPQIVAAQTYDEPAYSFSLRTPPGFTGSKSVEGGVVTWKLRNDKSGAALGADELVSVTVSALERTPGVDPEREFRDYVAEFASDILHGGSVENFRSARFAGREGFVGLVRGSFDTGAGLRPAVARVLLMEVGATHVLASAIALGRGDETYAGVGTPNGVFAPIGTTTESARPTSPANPQSSSSVSTQEPAAGEWTLPIIGLLGLAALVGGGFAARSILKRRVATAHQTTASAPQTTPAVAATPVPPPEPAPAAARFCTECGARLTAPGPCPACGAEG